MLRDAALWPLLSMRLSECGYEPSFASLTPFSPESSHLA